MGSNSDSNLGGISDIASLALDIFLRLNSIAALRLKASIKALSLSKTEFPTVISSPNYLFLAPIHNS
jgi:hypothetical protein